MTTQQWAATIGGRVRQHLINGQFDVVFKTIQGVLEHSSGEAALALFHNMVQLCATSKQHWGAAWCVSAMIELGFQPDRFMFNTAIGACAKGGDLNLTTKLWDDMVAHQIQANGASFRCMIIACEQARDGPQAEMWIQRMSEAGFPLCFVCFSSVIGAFAKVGKYAKAEEWYEKASAAGIVADMVIYNRLINACAQGGCPQRAKAWYTKSIAAGLTPDYVTYNSLINASAKIGDVETVEYWMEQMVHSNRAPNTVTYGSVLHACAKACDMDRAEYWMNVMVQNGLNPNVVCFNAVLHACAQKGDYARALKWFWTMSSMGVGPSRVSYNSIIDAYSRAGVLASAEAWLNRMVTAGFHADRPCYISLFFAFKQLLLDKASDPHRRRESLTDDEASVQAHYLIVKAYARVEKVELIRTHVNLEIASVCKAQRLGNIFREELKEICLASGGQRLASAVFQLLNVPIDSCTANNGACKGLGSFAGSLPPPGLFLSSHAVLEDENIFPSPMPSRSANSMQFEDPAQEERFGCSTLGSGQRSVSDEGSSGSSRLESSQHMQPTYIVTGSERSTAASCDWGGNANAQRMSKLTMLNSYQDEDNRSEAFDNGFYASAMCLSL